MIARSTPAISWIDDDFSTDSAERLNKLNILKSWAIENNIKPDIALIPDVTYTDAQRTDIESVYFDNERLALAKELKDAGIKDFSFMFEKNPDGSLSSNYVSTTNWTAFKAAKKNLDKLSQEEKKKWWRENWDFASNKPSAKPAK